MGWTTANHTELYLMRNQWLLSCLAPEPDEWHDAGFPLPTWLILTTVLAVYNNMLFRPTDCWRIYLDKCYSFIFYTADDHG